jgi:hypothetical protein
MKEGTLMKKLAMFAGIVVVLTSMAGLCVAGSPWGDQDITLSPKILVPDYSGTRLTIHTSIPASEVDNGSVTITVDGVVEVAPYSLGVDLQGNIVAKLHVNDVLGYIHTPSISITLNGRYNSGDSFNANGVLYVK